MQIDVGSHIADLLFEHNTVNIPGLGGFVSRYKAATADQVQGELYPPSKGLNFNNNLVGDDGLLAQHLHEKLGITLEEAQQAVESYVAEKKEAIDKREIIVFPNVGRLYKDYENNLQFLADTTNFNLDAYGLPTVRFYPVARSPVQGSSVRPATVQPQVAASAPAVSPIDRLLNNGLAIAAAAASIVILVVAYFIFFYKPSGGEGNAQRMTTSRVNVSPSLVEGQDGNSADPAEDTYDPQAESAYPDEAPSSKPEGLDTEGATITPGQQYFVIGIGVFGNEKNIQRLIERIYKAGYEPFTEPKGNLTRVGIQKAYTSESEIQTTLKDVRKKFSKDAKVLRK